MLCCVSLTATPGRECSRDECTVSYWSAHIYIISRKVFRTAEFGILTDFTTDLICKGLTTYDSQKSHGRIPGAHEKWSDNWSRTREAQVRFATKSFSLLYDEVFKQTDNLAILDTSLETKPHNLMPRIDRGTGHIGRSLEPSHAPAKNLWGGKGRIPSPTPTGLPRRKPLWIWYKAITRLRWRRSKLAPPY